jgi:hypothetical protein
MVGLLTAVSAGRAGRRGLEVYVELKSTGIPDDVVVPAAR